MWMEIKNEKDILNFMELMIYFHDSCIKEFKYISGAYVNEKLGMHAVNDQRILKIIIQRQFEDNPMVELEFKGLKYLNLFPTNEDYTCEILDASLFMHNEYLYWVDCGGITIDNIEKYEGTVICASKLRWRSINGLMGKDEYYGSTEK